MNRRWPAAIAAAGAAWYASESLRHRREQGDGYTLDGEALEVGTPEFLRACEELTAAAATEGSHAEVLVNGDAIFPAYLETIRQAESTINCLTYVYWRGDIAREVAGALADRARDGLDVNLLLDAVGTAKMERDLLDDLRDAGVTVARFRPPRPYAVRRAEQPHPPQAAHRRREGRPDGRRRDRGGVDGRRAGPRPLARHARPRHGTGRARPAGRVRGELAGGDRQRPRRPRAPARARARPRRRRADAGRPLLRRHRRHERRGPLLPRHRVRARADRAHGGVLRAAPAFIEALCDAADRGVAVRVLVPGSHIDKGFVRTAGRGTYEELLYCGVRIWEYGPTMLHAKTLVVDGAWASVGSVNFDNRSFQLHDEVTLCVQSRAFAGVLAEQFERDLAVSEEIDPERWKERGIVKRAGERCCASPRSEL